MNTKVSAGNPSPILQECLADASREARMLMEKLVDYTRHTLRERESTLRNFGDRNAVTEAIEQLNRHHRGMVDAFVRLVEAGFAAGSAGDAEAIKPQALLELRFDQLELMDESQVQTRVELARAQQMTLHAVEASLPELNTLTSALQGFPNVLPERNPFRPEVYLRALQEVVEKTGASSQVRMAWSQQMCALLGKELHGFYAFLNRKLQSKGIKPAGYTVTQVAGGAGVGRALYTPDVLPSVRSGEGVDAGEARRAPAVAQPIAQAKAGAVPAGAAKPRSAGPAMPVPPRPAPRPDPVASPESLLTVDRLRRLLADEPPHARHSAAAQPRQDNMDSVAARLEEFTRRFEREFELSPDASEGPPSDFATTMPAAFDAFEDPRDVDQVMQRLASRAPRRTGAQPLTVGVLRRQLRQHGEDMGHAVALEVVTLMIENIIGDPRLLAPVRQAVQDLEPALMQLVVADVRFFSDKTHAARRLLDEVTQRSLAFQTERSPGFAEFMKPVNAMVDMLSGAVIDNASPFDVALRELDRAWSEHRETETRKREQAVQALMQAEQRNLLAARVRQEVQQFEGLGAVAVELQEFLMGPWSQVVAQSRLGERAAEADPGGYFALIPELLWSAQPALARQNLGRLTRLIPSLLGRLREGLKTIDFPPILTSAFLEKLIVLHQAAYRPAVVSELAPAPAPAPVADPSAQGHEDLESAWLAPQEARASGFLTLPPEAGPDADAPTEPVGLPQLASADAVPLGLGAWVELLSEGRWVRTQLTWASPHGSLFLFTGADGSTQSMTRRMRDRLVAEGSLRVVADQPVVSGALDQVAKAALINTVARPPES